MKVYLDYSPSEASGKGKFLLRLEPPLRELGAEFTHKASKADVALGISRWRTKVSVPRVLRIDGIRIEKNKKAAWGNARIKKSILHSDVVVFQSEFAKRYVSKKLCSPKRSLVIHNGAPMPDYNRPVRAPGAPVRIALIANWGVRKHKRLKEMVAFLKWLLPRHPRWDAVIAGETRHHQDVSRLNYLGDLPNTSLPAFFAASDIVLNLSDLDWCPNAMVEALAAGVPVVGYANTAVGELVEKGGLKPLAPVASYDEIEQHIISLSDAKVDRDRFDIARAAECYYQIFRSLV